MRHNPSNITSLWPEIPGGNWYPGAVLFLGRNCSARQVKNQIRPGTDPSKVVRLTAQTTFPTLAEFNDIFLQYVDRGLQLSRHDTGEGADTTPPGGSLVERCALGPLALLQGSYATPGVMGRTRFPSLRS